MIRKIQIVFVFLLVGVYIKFFDARFINSSLLNYLLFLFLILVVAISVPYLSFLRRGFILPIQLLIASVLVSVVMANMYWDQSLMESVIATAPYLVFMLFFF